MNNQQIHIRRATINDASCIALLGRITFTEAFNHLFEDKNDLYEYCIRTFLVDKIKAGLKKENNAFWIVFVNELPVGYAKLKLKSETEFVSSENSGQLQKIYVLQDFHGLGIGNQLRDKMLETAQEIKLENLWLTTLKKNNEKAVNFYLKTGFTIVGTTNFQIGKLKSELHVMTKKL